MKKLLLILTLFLVSCNREKELETQNEELKHNLKECGYILYETEKVISLQEGDIIILQQRIDSLIKLNQKQ